MSEMGREFLDGWPPEPVRSRAAEHITTVVVLLAGMISDLRRERDDKAAAVRAMFEDWEDYSDPAFRRDFEALFTDGAAE